MSQEQIRKEQRNQAAKLLHDRRDTPEVQALLQWLRVQMEEAKDSLITAETDMVKGLQARAKLCRELQMVVAHGPRSGPQSLN